MHERRRRAALRAGGDVSRSAARGASHAAGAARLRGRRHRSGRVRVLPRRRQGRARGAAGAARARRSRCARSRSRTCACPTTSWSRRFLSEYYARSSFVPNEILVPTPIEAASGLEQMLGEQRGGRVQLSQPQRGKKAKLVRMAMDNAAHAFREKARAREDMQARLRADSKAARPAGAAGAHRVHRRLAHRRQRHGRGDRRIRARRARPQALPQLPRAQRLGRRRLRRDARGAACVASGARSRAAAGWELPDLLVVDGGKGQLAIAQRALAEIGIELPVAALAKEKPNTLGEQLVDRVYLPGRKNAIELREGGAALQILAHARDEAHRVSNALRVKLGKKHKLKSGLDDVARHRPQDARAAAQGVRLARARRASRHRAADRGRCDAASSSKRCTRTCIRPRSKRRAGCSRDRGHRGSRARAATSSTRWSRRRGRRHSARVRVAALYFGDGFLIALTA